MTDKEKIIFDVCEWYSKGYLPEQVPSKCVLKAMDVWAMKIIEHLVEKQTDFSMVGIFDVNDIVEIYTEITNELQSK